MCWQYQILRFKGYFYYFNKNINSLRKFYSDLSRQVKKSNKNIQLFKKLKEKGVFIGSYDLNVMSELNLKVSLADDEEKDKINW